MQVVSGRVISQLDRGEIPLAGASVYLLEDLYNGRVIAETSSGADGSYSFNAVRSGRRLLKFAFHDLAPFYVRLRVLRKKSKSRQSGRGSTREVVIVMGADFRKPCGGSFAQLR
ncbi:MAG TPA: hypothetical protein VLZ81_04375 [Blastocatellia bacterium]|nr:hypothetical protein [Blastocatellia bacterium]